MNDNKYTKNVNESIRIWQMKAVAIIFVTCAHCSGIAESTSVPCMWASMVLQSMGSLGVPIFFVLSGYLYQYKPWGKWIKTKLYKLMVPWLFCGAIVYAYICLRKGGFSLGGLLTWELGYNTYLWYMSITFVTLFFAQLVSWICQKLCWNELYVWVCWFGICILLLALEKYSIIFMLPYLNPFRWGWLFGIGIVIKRWELLKKMPVFNGAILLIIVFICLYTSKIGELSYWSRWWWVISLLVITCTSMMYISFADIGKFICDVGKKSFSIYLLHMPVAGIVTNLSNRLVNGMAFFVLIRPFVVVGVTYLGILALQYFVKTLIKKENITRVVDLFIGIR